MHAHILQSKLKKPQYKTHTKLNRHNTFNYLQYKVTLKYMVLLSPKKFAVVHFTALHFKTNSLRINHISSLHISSFHVISLMYTQSPLEFPLLVTTFLALFLKVFGLQGKEARKPAYNCIKVITNIIIKIIIITTKTVCRLNCLG